MAAVVVVEAEAKVWVRVVQVDRHAVPRIRTGGTQGIHPSQGWGSLVQAWCITGGRAHAHRSINSSLAKTSQNNTKESNKSLVVHVAKFGGSMQKDGLTGAASARKGRGLTSCSRRRGEQSHTLGTTSSRSIQG